LPEIGLLGRSNVGKSSLLNALTGRRALARTSRTPGKTQACNVFAVDQRFYLVDLPGYGYAQAPMGVRRRLMDLLTGYISRREPLAGVVWLLDVRRDPSPDDLAIGRLLEERGLPILVAMGIPADQCVVTSARTRDGIPDLREAIDAFVARERTP
jgi:GTP-binding protein